MHALFGNDVERIEKTQMRLQVALRNKETIIARDKHLFLPDVLKLGYRNVARTTGESRGAYNTRLKKLFTKFVVDLKTPFPSSKANNMEPLRVDLENYIFEENDDDEIELKFMSTW